MMQIADLKMVALAVMIVMGFWIIKAEPPHVGLTYPTIAAAPVVEVSTLPG
ncbi:hypothetical protein ABLN87_05960 [Ruegeria sp. SCPT10]|uniref:hypothetical protein n=1 Tax=Ruegeria sp. SCP10 TaxID=3141377 RepID=UPI00333CB525